MSIHLMNQAWRTTLATGATFVLVSVCDTANDEAVGYVGGEAFFAAGDGARHVRLCYSNVAERDIPEAVQRFGRALDRARR